MATTPEPQPEPLPEPHHPEIPIPNPDDHPAKDQPIDPSAGLPPETVNAAQEDEEPQSQSVAASAQIDDFGLEDSEKIATGGDDDDVLDLVDHMRGMVRSGRIDFDAYRGERNDDDEEGILGPAAETE